MLGHREWVDLDLDLGKAGPPLLCGAGNLGKGPAESAMNPEKKGRGTSEPTGSEADLKSRSTHRRVGPTMPHVHATESHQGEPVEPVSFTEASRNSPALREPSGLLPAWTGPVRVTLNIVRHVTSLN